MPFYTARFLVDRTKKNVAGIRKFAHMTAVCGTFDDNASVLAAIKAPLTNMWGMFPRTVKAKSVVNFGTDEDPFYVLELALNGPTTLALSSAFDSLMGTEKDGIMRTWVGKNPRVPHITLGKHPEDKVFGESLVGQEIHFCSADLKQVGPHDPIFSTS